MDGSLGHMILLILETNFKVLRDLTRSDYHPAHQNFQPVRAGGDLARPPEKCKRRSGSVSMTGDNPITPWQEIVTDFCACGVARTSGVLFARPATTPSLRGRTTHRHRLLCLQVSARIISCTDLQAQMPSLSCSYNHAASFFKFFFLLVRPAANLTKTPNQPLIKVPLSIHDSVDSFHLDMADPDQPAIGPDGQLLDASKMVWHNDPDDAKPIQPTPSGSTGTRFRLSVATTNTFFLAQVSAHVQFEQLQARG